MATVADLLGLMEVLDNELETGSGEVDEAQSILSLTQAQHYFELLAASFPKILQDTVNLATASATEKTTWTSSIRRVDALWYLDTNGLPVRQIERIEEIGGHVPSLPWPLQISIASAAGGAPFGYYGNMRDFYWMPIPDGVYSVRLYGFIKKSEFVTRASAFSYPDEIKLAIASFANKLMDVGVDDATLDIDKLSAQLYGPILKSYRRFDRSKPSSRYYSEFHTT